MQCIESDGAVTDRVVERAAAWLADPVSATAAIDRNYEIGNTRFSYEVVRETFRPLLTG